MKIKVIGSAEHFEEFTSDETKKIINLDVKACEKSYMFQECFIAVITYEDSCGSANVLPKFPSLEDVINNVSNPVHRETIKKTYYAIQRLGNFA